jgi:hypothetical protein
MIAHALTATLIGAATLMACAPPPAQVSGMVQLDRCTENAEPSDRMGCRQWVNHLPAWGYPAEMKWEGPLYMFEWDRDHNGGELL